MTARDQKEPFCNYHAAAEHAGLALIAALRQFLPGKSWSEVRRLVQGRFVEINGNLCLDEGRKLLAGDVVKVWRAPRNAPPSAADVKIRYADRHVVVVEKPAGVTTLRHSEEQSWPAQRRQLQPTLDEIVRRILARKAAGKRGGRGGKPALGLRMRAVHRLDRDTSGLIVFALARKPNAAWCRCSANTPCSGSTGRSSAAGSNRRRFRLPSCATGATADAEARPCPAQANAR